MSVATIHAVCAQLCTAVHRCSSHERKRPTAALYGTMGSVSPAINRRCSASATAGAALPLPSSATVLEERDLPGRPGVVEGFWQWDDDTGSHRIRYQRSGESGPPIVCVVSRQQRRQGEAAAPVAACHLPRFVFWGWCDLHCTFSYGAAHNSLAAAACPLQHGFGGSADHFRHQTAALGAAGHRVYAVDLLGYGFRPVPAAPCAALALLRPEARTHALRAPTPHTATSRAPGRAGGSPASCTTSTREAASAGARQGRGQRWASPPALLPPWHPLPSWSRQLRAFMSAFLGGEPAFLVCNSVGGLAGLQAALDAPASVAAVQVRARAARRHAALAARTPALPCPALPCAARPPPPRLTPAHPPTRPPTHAHNTRTHTHTTYHHHHRS